MGFYMPQNNITHHNSLKGCVCIQKNLFSSKDFLCWIYENAILNNPYLNVEILISCQTSHLAFQYQNHK